MTPLHIRLRRQLRASGADPNKVFVICGQLRAHREASRPETKAIIAAAIKHNMLEIGARR